MGLQTHFQVRVQGLGLGRREGTIPYVLVTPTLRTWSRPAAQSRGSSPGRQVPAHAGGATARSLDDRRAARHGGADRWLRRQNLHRITVQHTATAPSGRGRSRRWMLTRGRPSDPAYGWLRSLCYAEPSAPSMPCHGVAPVHGTHSCARKLQQRMWFNTNPLLFSALCIFDQGVRNGRMHI